MSGKSEHYHRKAILSKHSSWPSWREPRRSQAASVWKFVNSDGCGGLQASEFVSPAVRFGADSFRDVGPWRLASFDNVRRRTEHSFESRWEQLKKWSYPNFRSVVVVGVGQLGRASGSVSKLACQMKPTSFQCCCSRVSVRRLTSCVSQFRATVSRFSCSNDHRNSGLKLGAERAPFRRHRPAA
jgi:hypothetical protein